MNEVNIAKQSVAKRMSGACERTARATEWLIQNAVVCEETRTLRQLTELTWAQLISQNSFQFEKKT